MARARGVDPGTMTCLAGRDLAAYLEVLDADRRPFMPPRYHVSLDDFPVEEPDDA